MTRIVLTALALTLLFGFFVTAPADDKKTDRDADQRFYELRIYTTHDGKLDELNARFRNHTNKLFKKHGMELVAYWTPAEASKSMPYQPDNTLIYVLAYPSKEAREKSWKGFINDPDWKQAFQASRVDGPLVKRVQNCFMQPTDYSPIQ